MNKSARTRERKALKAAQDSICGFISSDSDNYDSSSSSSGVTSVRGSDLTGFNYVLVDAECTHDASYRHMRYIKSSGVSGDVNDGSEEQEKDEETTAGLEYSSGVSKPNATLSHTTASSCTSSSSATTVFVDSKNNNNSSSGDVDSSSAVDKLRTLQRGLLMNGFTRLAEGGTLVYSTCSQEQEQNETVVQWLLDQCPDTARLVPIDFGRDADCKVVNNANDATESVTTAQLMNPSELLSLSLPEIVAYSSTLSRTELTALSTSICKYFSARGQPQLEPSLLVGTVRVGYRGGMSGHFIAKITKIGGKCQNSN